MKSTETVSSSHRQKLLKEVPTLWVRVRAKPEPHNVKSARGIVRRWERKESKRQDRIRDAIKRARKEATLVILTGDSLKEMRAAIDRCHVAERAALRKV